MIVTEVKMCGLKLVDAIVCKTKGKSDILCSNALHVFSTFIPVILDTALLK